MTMIKRKSKKKGTPPKARTLRHFYRLWRIPEPFIARGWRPRYTGLKGIYWFYFSIQRRKEDFEKYGGECVDQCGKYAESYKDFDGGHFHPAASCGFALLFHPLNVHGQLRACNNPRFSPHSLIGFQRGIEKRYGRETIDMLWKLYKKDTPTKEWTTEEYEKRIQALPSFQQCIPTTPQYETLVKLEGETA